jgi:hypothetical protein
MDAEQITQAVQGITALRPRMHSKPKLAPASQAWRSIEVLKEQAELVEIVRCSLPGHATIEQAAAWLDTNTPAWRLGPAPRGKPLFVEKVEADDGD